MPAPASDELTPDELARIRRDINHVIETQGWITLSAYPSETLPAFTCTAGMGRKALPELLVFGPFPDEARATTGYSGDEGGPQPLISLPVRG